MHRIYLKYANKKYLKIRNLLFHFKIKITMTTNKNSTSLRHTKGPLALQGRDLLSFRSVEMACRLWQDRNGGGVGLGSKP